jgi:hypothetical protein
LDDIKRALETKLYGKTSRLLLLIKQVLMNENATKKDEEKPKVRKNRSGRERRKYPRLNPTSVPFLKSVALGQGNEVDAIDISEGGILVETEVRLRPLMKIHLKLVTRQETIRIEGTVLRSSISSIKGSPRYKSAIAFDAPLRMFHNLSKKAQVEKEESKPELITLSDAELNKSQSAFGEFDEDSSILTIMTPDKSSTPARERPKANGW